MPTRNNTCRAKDKAPYGTLFNGWEPIGPDMECIASEAVNALHPQSYDIQYGDDEPVDISGFVNLLWCLLNLELNRKFFVNHILSKVSYTGYAMASALKFKYPQRSTKYIDIHIPYDGYISFPEEDLQTPIGELRARLSHSIQMEKDTQEEVKRIRNARSGYYWSFDTIQSFIKKCETFSGLGQHVVAFTNYAKTLLSGGLCDEDYVGYDNDNNDDEFDCATLRQLWFNMFEEMETDDQKAVWWRFDYDIDMIQNSRKEYLKSSAALGQFPYPQDQTAKSLVDVLCKKEEAFSEETSRLKKLVTNYDFYTQANELVDKMKKSIKDPTAFIESLIAHVHLLNTHERCKSAQRDWDEEEDGYWQDTDHYNGLQFQRSCMVVAPTLHNRIMTARQNMMDVFESSGLFTSEAMENYCKAKEDADAESKSIAQEMGVEKFTGLSWNFEHGGIFPQKEMPTVEEALECSFSDEEDY